MTSSFRLKLTATYFNIVADHFDPICKDQVIFIWTLYLFQSMNKLLNVPFSMFTAIVIQRKMGPNVTHLYFA